MKTTILAFSFLFFCTALMSQSAAVKEVADHVEALRVAMIEAKESVLDKLIANELSYGHSSGVLETKADFMEVILSGKNDYKTLELTDQSIVVSDNIALVRHTMVSDLVNDGVRSSIKVGVLQVWKKNKNRWQLLARQAFK